MGAPLFALIACEQGCRWANSRRGWSPPSDSCFLRPCCINETSLGGALAGAPPVQSSADPEPFRASTACGETDPTNAVAWLHLESTESQSGACALEPAVAADDGRRGSARLRALHIKASPRPLENSGLLVSRSEGID
jgi:hypothetical protein